MAKFNANRVVPFDFKPFSEKQLLVLGWWMLPQYKNKNALICDGAVRSGKTVSMALSFVMWAMENFDECDFAICGKTIGSLNRNVINTL